MLVDLIETFKIIKRISYYGRHFFFQYFSSKTDFKNWICFVNRVIHFWNKLPNQIKISNCIENFKIELDGYTNNGKKKIRNPFLEISNEFCRRI